MVKNGKCKKKTSRVINLVKDDPNEDIVPLIEAHIKEKRISKVYVDGGAKMCVMSKKLICRLGLRVNAPSL